MTKTKVYHRESGHLGQYEDTWWLIQNEDGSVEIEHETDYVRVNGLSRTEGATRYSLEDGLAAAPYAASQKIKAALGID